MLKTALIFTALCCSINCLAQKSDLVRVGKSSGDLKPIATTQQEVRAILYGNLINEYNDTRPNYGIIIIDIEADSDGNIISAVANNRLSTITDTALIKKCENTVLKSKLNPINYDPKKQKGTVKFTFKYNKQY